MPKDGRETQWRTLCESDSPRQLPSLTRQTTITVLYSACWSSGRCAVTDSCISLHSSLLGYSAESKSSDLVLESVWHEFSRMHDTDINL